MVKLDGQLFMPILCLEDESKKVHKTQVLISYSVCDVTYVFGDPLNTMYFLEALPNFPQSNARKLINQHDIIDLDFCQNRSGPSSPKRNYFKWLAGVSALYKTY